MFRGFFTKKEYMDDDFKEFLTQFMRKIDHMNSLISTSVESAKISNKALVGSFKDSFDGFSKILTILSQKVTIDEGLDKSYVYAYYLLKLGGEGTIVNKVIDAKDMMLQVVADTDSEAETKCRQQIIVMGLDPDEWRTIGKTKIDIAFPPEPEIKTEREKNIESYINDLLYTRDHFTETPHEKGIITKIINKIKESHA